MIPKNHEDPPCPEEALRRHSSSDVQTAQPGADNIAPASLEAEAAFFAPLARSAQDRFGLGYTPEAELRLHQALSARRERLKLDTWADYAALLRREPEEWQNVWPLALPRAGVFFRPAAQFEVARELLAEWSVMAPDRTLRVLSLGCGPGYETCSLAMMLEETGLKAKNWRVELYGLDLNEEAVGRAESAVFEEADLDWLTPAQRRKWFTPRAGGFYFKRELAPVPQLAAGNLYEPENWPFGETDGAFDLIFARALTFEAPPPAPRRLAGILRRLLAPSGFVFTAPGEFLPDDSGELHLEERSGVTYYRRGVPRLKANRPHRSKKQRAGRDDGAARPGAPAPAAVGPSRRERGLLASAAEELAAGRPEAARALADEVMLSALDDNRSSPEAWALAAEIETALGRTETAAAIAEVLGRVQTESSPAS